MSKTNNLLTKYFRKTKKNINNKPISQLTLATDEQEDEDIENESPSSKRLKLNENESLSTTPSPTCSRALASLTISTSLPSSISTSPPTSTYSTSTTTISTDSTSTTTSPTCSRALSSLTISTSLQSSISTSSPPTTTYLTSPANSIPLTNSPTSTYSTSTTNPIPLICSPTSTCSTSSTYLTSPSERDPSNGPAAAKQFIFLGPYQPDSKFPTVDHRHFCQQWYSMYRWLEYSKIYDRAFCFVCRLSYGTGKTDSWFTVTGCNTWKNAVTRFKNHQFSIVHKEALLTWEDMKKNYNNNTDVLKLMDKQHMKQAEENRAYLIEIIRTIVFLGRQGIAFRGHREHHQSSNRGNFLELHELRSLDNQLIKNNLHKLKFTDHKIQNEIIELLQQQILTEILNECRRTKYFSVMIDETKDIASHEQVSLVLRYVDEKFNVYERFIGFERTATMTGEALAELLIKWLNKLDLKLEYLVGQCYDGAGNMRGEYQGVAARLREIAPLGIYIHCSGHVLNLCLIDVSARVPSVRNNFGVVSSLYNLIEGSAKRHHVFEQVQREAGLKIFTIKQLCETRWTCRLECLKVILLRYNEIITTLEVMNDPAAFLLLNPLQSFDFIFHLLLMTEIYLLTNILSKFLQSSDISLTDALAQVKTTIDTLKSLRNETEFERMYNETLKFCDENAIEPPTKIRQKKTPVRFGGGIDAAPILSVKDHYQVNICYVGYYYCFDS